MSAIDTTTHAEFLTLLTPGESPWQYRSSPSDFPSNGNPWPRDAYRLAKVLREECDLILLDHWDRGDNGLWAVCAPKSHTIWDVDGELTHGETLEEALEAIGIGESDGLDIEEVQPEDTRYFEE